MTSQSGTIIAQNKQYSSCVDLRCRGAKKYETANKRDRPGFIFCLHYTLSSR